ncbi:hypothetical protein H7U35_04970 [Mediterranea massiliensis]|uniref:Uncharacterized protein n=1 Tax=Mediterranea massiliensis TaxID=1841865 RepID=A0ABS2DYX4_9BACT|nr:hypothetical protein [Mediterranea massiliensis]MBM6734574.1 hypothetical protein [Mediterranea massiliensis]
MEESNREELIRVIKDEQEITKDYFINVAQVRGLINLDLNDFRKFADKLKPIMEVIVDARISVSAQIETAMEEIRKQQTTVVSAIILSVSFKPSYPLMMEELEGMADCLNNLTKQDIEVIWGIQERAYISNQRSVSLFVFV